jgi:hypothetical protein
MEAPRSTRSVWASPYGFVVPWVGPLPASFEEVVPLVGPLPASWAFGDAVLRIKPAFDVALWVGPLPASFVEVAPVVGPLPASPGAARAGAARQLARKIAQASFVSEVMRLSICPAAAKKTRPRDFGSDFREGSR